MNTSQGQGHRQHLLNGLLRFVGSVTEISGVRRIALLGSIVTTKPHPKDIDVLVVVADDADLAPVAACARRLQGHAQSLNRGADVFLADERGTYIGRTCHWKDCRPGVRRACDALHCGRRPYLHDDLDTIALNHALVHSPPITLWPHVERCGQLPRDVEEVVGALELRLTSHEPDFIHNHQRRQMSVFFETFGRMATSTLAPLFAQIKEYSGDA